MSDPAPFDRALLRRRRRRAAPDFAAHDFLMREVADRLADRLSDIKRDFPQALELGAGHGILRDELRGRGGIVELFQASPDAATGGQLVADEELLPVKPAALDAILSLLTLHWVNDLPGTLAQIRATLKPDGLFLGAMFGGTTLHELRQAWLVAESECEGGASPRVAPFTDPRDAGALLQRAGFALPVVDVDTITVTYSDPFSLMRELRGMGESSVLAGRRRSFTRRATLLRAAAVYQEQFAQADGRIPATFQILYLTGWAPHPSQQQPLRPGSAKSRLADALVPDAEKGDG